MVDEPILSICIPTYNRADCLKKTLELTIPICESNNILIYISDNCSEDNTEDVVNRFTKDCHFVHYHKHDKNIGPDDNFEYVLKMPSTKYRWLMADTSYIDEINTVIDDLKNLDYDGYILNGGDGTRHFILPDKKKTYHDSISLMEDIGWHLTWISCMIYNERLINSMNFERYKNSSFNQTALMFEPTANRKCLIFFNPDLTVKNIEVAKESGWLYHVFDVMYRQWYLLVMSLPIYYPYESKLKCIKDNAKNARLLSIIFHIRRRSEAKWGIKDVYKNRFFIKQSCGSYFFLLLVGVIPSWFLRIFISPLSKSINYLKHNKFTETGLRRVFKWYIGLSH